MIWWRWRWWGKKAKTGTKSGEEQLKQVKCINFTTQFNIQNYYSTRTCFYPLRTAAEPPPPSLVCLWRHICLWFMALLFKLGKYANTSRGMNFISSFQSKSYFSWALLSSQGDDKRRLWRSSPITKSNNNPREEAATESNQNVSKAKAGVEEEEWGSDSIPNSHHVLVYVV